MLFNKNHRYILLIQKLNRIIEIALPKSLRLSSTTEIAFKLIPAVAVALLTTYLILFVPSSWELPTSAIAGAIYCFGMLALSTYICNNRNNKIMRHLHAIATIVGFVWLLLHLKKVSQPILSSNLLYAASFLVSTSAIIFFLINSVYATPRQSNQFSFDDCRSEAIAKLAEFSTKEINLAVFDTRKMRDRLQRRIDVYLLLAPLLTILLWNFSTLLFSLSNHSWWLDGGYQYGSILSLLLSATVVFIVIDSIRSRRKSDRYFLYVLILLEYDLERLKFTNSLLRRKLN